MKEKYIGNIVKEFSYYKTLAEKAMVQIPDEKLDWQFNSESNSIVTIVKHLAGNMLSRWTDFLSTDGEKEWRKRDDEFENEHYTRENLLNLWNKGWTCLFDSLNALTPEDLDKVVYIRNQGHTVYEAINRQLAHYPYHVGQIVFISKMVASDWSALTIAKNKSIDFNAEKFSKEKSIKHFTDKE